MLYLQINAYWPEFNTKKVNIFGKNKGGGGVRAPAPPLNPPLIEGQGQKVCSAFTLSRQR